jgi:hypothetical protein
MDTKKELRRPHARMRFGRLHRARRLSEVSLLAWQLSLTLAASARKASVLDGSTELRESPMIWRAQSISGAAYVVDSVRSLRTQEVAGSSPASST